MDSAHRSLSVNIESGMWNCHRCGAKGKLTEFADDNSTLVDYKTRRYSNAKRIFAAAPPPSQANEPDADSVAGFIRQIKNVSTFAGSPAQLYLESRQIPAELAKSARCKYARHWGRIGASVIFPIADESGKPIAAAGRSIEGNGKQTFGPKSTGVFSTPGALDVDSVAIVEAPIDALSLALAGLPSIALCGTSGLAGWLKNRLAQPVKVSTSRTVYLAFDADNAGDGASVKIEKQLPLVNCKRLRPDGAKDWNAVLTTFGVDQMRTQLPMFSSICDNCGAPVALVPYPDSGGWCWYECANCGSTGTKCL